MDSSLGAMAPAATSSFSLSEVVCVRCGAPAVHMCGRCRVARYCSVTCQRIHWKSVHKRECGVLSEQAKAELDQITNQQKIGETLLQCFRELKEEKGLGHAHTMNAAFACIDHFVFVYRLATCEELLDEIAEECEARHDISYVKWVQAKAFLRFKQARYREAVELFEEQLHETDESPALLENMGHAYNSIGNAAMAEECFQRALDLLEILGLVEDTKKSSRGGILLGLGASKQTQGKVEQAVPFLRMSLAWFQKYKPNTSHQAKSTAALAKALDELGYIKEAERHYRDAVRLYSKFCGRGSPLTCNAMAKLGMMLYSNGYLEAEEVCQEAFELNCALERDLVRVATIATLLVQLHNLRRKSPDRLYSYAAACAKCAGEALEKIFSGGPVEECADHAVLYKAYAEDLMVCKKFHLASSYFERAIRILLDVPGRESRELIEVCDVLLEKGCYPKFLNKRDRRIRVGRLKARTFHEKM